MTSEQIDVYEGSGNVFADLGYEDAEEMLVKAAVLSRVQEVISSLDVTQAQVAELLGID